MMPSGENLTLSEKLYLVCRKSTFREASRAITEPDISSCLSLPLSLIVPVATPLTSEANALTKGFRMSSGRSKVLTAMSAVLLAGA